MGKRSPAPKLPAPIPVSNRQARAARAANGERDLKPENTVESLVATWHTSYVERERWKTRSELDGGKVKEAMRAAGVTHVSTPDGTPTLTERSGPTNINWEALARANVDPAVIERELPKHTTVGAPTVALNAPREWGIEAKSKAG